MVEERRRIISGQTWPNKMSNSRKKKFDILKIKLLFTPCCKLEYKIIL